MREGGQHRTDLRRGEEEVEQLHAVPRDDRDAVSLRDADIPEEPGGAVGALVERGVRVLLVRGRVRDGDAVGREPRASRRQRSDPLVGAVALRVRTGAAALSRSDAPPLEPGVSPAVSGDPIEERPDPVVDSLPLLDDEEVRAAVDPFDRRVREQPGEQVRVPDRKHPVVGAVEHQRRDR